MPLWIPSCGVPEGLKTWDPGGPWWALSWVVSWALLWALESGLFRGLYRSFRNHYILNSKTIQGNSPKGPDPAAGDVIEIWPHIIVVQRPKNILFEIIAFCIRKALNHVTVMAANS